jgi:hypothetical protein
VRSVALPSPVAALPLAAITHHSPTSVAANLPDTPPAPRQQ